MALHTHPGQRRGVEQRHIGAGFGKGPGDRIRFRVRLPKALTDGRLLLRYRNLSNQLKNGS